MTEREIAYARLVAAKANMDRAFDAYERAAREWMDALRECDRVDGIQGPWANKRE